MFFMFAAEAVAKLFTNYRGEGDSRRSVSEFFLFICSDEQRKRFVAAFRSALPKVVGTPAAIAGELYRIRCVVVHRWEYFGLNPRDEVVRELRAIVLEGAAHAARTLVNPGRRAQVITAIHAKRNSDYSTQKRRNTVNPRGPKGGK
jgi:hypothetical protein